MALNINRETRVGLVAVAISLCLTKRRTGERRWWERPHLGLHNRSVYGQQNLLNEMRLTDVDSFVSIIRLRPQTFDKLLSIVGPTITHVSNRPSIDPSTRLSVTLRYLATGESPKSLSYTYRLGISTTECIIKETLGVIYNELQPLVLPKPTSKNGWRSLMDFIVVGTFPIVVDQLMENRSDLELKPKKSGSEYWNYKKFFSTVMMASCDHQYKFTVVDTGCQGRNNDVVVLNHSQFGIELFEGTLNLPGEKDIEFGPRIPHYFLADEIFGLHPNLITPYPGRGTGKLSYIQKIFNYRQSRGRRVIENTFGIFANVWGIFHTEINTDPGGVDRIVMAAACLHNFRIMENEPNDFIPRENSGNFPFEFPTVYEPLLSDITQGASRSTTGRKFAETIRSELADYFISGGQIYWQDNLVN